MGPHVEVRPVDAVAALDVVAGTVVRLDEVRAATGMDAVVARPWNYVVLVPPAVNVADGVRAPAAEGIVVPSPGINLVLAREASNAVVVRRAENPVVRDRTGQRGRRDAGDSGQRGQRNECSDRRSSSRKKFVLLLPFRLFLQVLWLQSRLSPSPRVSLRIERCEIGQAAHLLVSA